MAKHGTLLTVKMPPEPLIQMIRQKLKEKLEQYANEMKSNVAKNTTVYPAPGRWISNVQSYIDVEDLGGGAVITFGVGLESGTPEQALWQAYIFNKGSGQYGGKGLIYSLPAPGTYYDVDVGGGMPTGGRTTASGEPLAYPQFGKGPNHWFDDVADKIGVTLPSLMREIVEESVASLFASGAWTLKGHRVTVKL